MMGLGRWVSEVGKLRDEGGTRWLEREKKIKEEERRKKGNWRERERERERGNVFLTREEKKV